MSLLSPRPRDHSSSSPSLSFPIFFVSPSSFRGRNSRGIAEFFITNFFISASQPRNLFLSTPRVTLHSKNFAAEECSCESLEISFEENRCRLVSIEPRLIAGNMKCEIPISDKEKKKRRGRNKIKDETKERLISKCARGALYGFLAAGREVDRFAAAIYVYVRTPRYMVH